MRERHKMFRRDSRAVATRLLPEEEAYLCRCAINAGVTKLEYIRAIIIDAIVEEGFDARRFRSPGDTQGRESLQAPRAPGQ